MAHAGFFHSGATSLEGAVDEVKIPPTNENPYPDNAGQNPFFAWEGITGSTSAPASAAGGTSGGLPSVPMLNKIPNVKDIQPLVNQAELKMRSLR